MATVLLEKDEHSRSVLVSLLNKIDYGPVFAGATPRKIDYFLACYHRLWIKKQPIARKFLVFRDWIHDYGMAEAATKQQQSATENAR